MANLDKLVASAFAQSEGVLAASAACIAHQESAIGGVFQLLIYFLSDKGGIVDKTNQSKSHYLL